LELELFGVAEGTGADADWVSLELSEGAEGDGSDPLDSSVGEGLSVVVGVGAAALGVNPPLAVGEGATLSLLLLLLLLCGFSGAGAESPLGVEEEGKTPGTT